MSFSPILVQTRAELAEQLAKLRAAGSVGLVPTMGALHEGHLSLVDASHDRCDATVATIFVNPTQFGPNEDLERYPRDLEGDLEKLGRRGVDLVFAPEKGEVYRSGHETYVEVGAVGAPLEGVCRPGHFRGVATVVLKLFLLVPADLALFGRKDYQQTLVVKQMVHDFDLPIAIEVCPIVREADGLAMSSRNAYLNTDERRRALALWQSLQQAEEMVAAGERDAEKVSAAVTQHLQQAGQAEIDYVALVREGTVEPVVRIDGPTRLCLAARIGQTRLIDNHLLGE